MRRLVSPFACALALSAVGCPLTVSDDFSISGAGAGGSGGATSTSSSSGGSGGAGAGGTGGADDCGPCPPNAILDPHGVFACQGNACVITCDATFGDCNDQLSDGCEEELTSPSACGACDRDCAGGSCTGDPLACGPVKLTTANGARSLAADDTHLYWGNSGGTVRRIPLAGGVGEQVAAWSGEIFGVALDATHVYFTAKKSQLLGDVVRAPLGGGPAQPLSVDEAFPHDIVVDDVSVYFTAEEADAVRRLPKGGGASSAVLGGLLAPTGLKLQGGVLTVTDTWNTPSRLVSVGTDGTNASTLASSDTLRVRGLTVFDGGVLWTERTGGANSMGRVLWRDASGTTTALAIDQPRPHTVATDGTYAYFTSPANNNVGEGSIRRVPLAGGPVRILAEGEDRPRDIIVAGDSVYYGTDNAVKRMVR